MSAIKTIIRVIPTDSTFNIDGEWTAAQIQASYSQAIPGINNMKATETRAQSPEGEVLTITFNLVSGNKGIV